MNISLEKIDNVNAVLTAVIEPADYNDSYTKAIKDFKKKANMPGFRQGMVPVGLIKKQFGVNILADEVNKLLQNELFGYIRENKINMLGEPLPTEENNNVVIAEGETFTFKFDIALAPGFKAEVSKDDTVVAYDVQVSDEMLENQVNMYRQRGGQYKQLEEGETYADNDMIKGIITEQGVETPVVAEDVVMLPKYFKNDDQKALFAEAKKGDVITFNPSVAYDNNEAELTSLLKVEKEDVANHKGDFTIQITEITRYVMGDLTEELFNQIYPEAGIKTEEDFKAKVKEDMTAQFAKDADFRFIMDLRTYLTEKVGKLEFPDEKLKKIMLVNAKGDQAKVDENYDKSIEELTWHLIKEQLVEQTGVKVDDEDVINMAKDVTRMQFAQYGMMNVPEEYLENSAREMLKKRETVDNLIDRCVEMKLGAAVKELVTLETKSVTVEEFNKLFEN